MGRGQKDPKISAKFPKRPRGNLNPNRVRTRAHVQPSLYESSFRPAVQSLPNSNSRQRQKLYLITAHLACIMRSLVLLIALAVAANAADICETYSPAECVLHADSCSLCKKGFGKGKELCFSYKVSAKLPPRESSAPFRVRLSSTFGALCKYPACAPRLRPIGGAVGYLFLEASLSVVHASKPEAPCTLGPL